MRHPSLRPGPQEWRPVPSSALSGEELRISRCWATCPAPLSGAEAAFGTPARDEEVRPAGDTRPRQVAGPGERSPLVLSPSPTPPRSLLSLKLLVGLLGLNPVSSPRHGSLKLSAPRGSRRSRGAGRKGPEQPHLSSHPPPKPAGGSASHPHSGNTQSSARLRPLPSGTGRPSLAPSACAARRARSAAGAAAAASPAGWGPGGRWRAREAAGGREKGREGGLASA